MKRVVLCYRFEPRNRLLGCASARRARRSRGGHESRCAPGGEAAREIGNDALPHALEMGDAASNDAIVKFIRAELGRLDILMNNAAIVLEETSDIESVEPDVVEKTFHVNAVGPLLLTQKVAPLLRKSRHGSRCFLHVR